MTPTPSDPLGDGPILDNESEDWIKGSSWDFHRDDGTPIDDLDEFCACVGMSRHEAATKLLNLPFGRSAPERLKVQAIDEVRSQTW